MREVLRRLPHQPALGHLRGSWPVSARSPIGRPPSADYLAMARTRHTKRQNKRGRRSHSCFMQLRFLTARRVTAATSRAVPGRLRDVLTIHSPKRRGDGRGTDLRGRSHARHCSLTTLAFLSVLGAASSVLPPSI